MVTPFQLALVLALSVLGCCACPRGLTHSRSSDAHAWRLSQYMIDIGGGPMSIIN